MAKWSIPIAPLVEKGKAKLARAVQMAAYATFNQVQLQWPVATGLSRGNWQFGWDIVPTGPVALLDPSGIAAGAQAAQALTAKMGGVLYYTNNMPYAKRIEYEGWSAQAPNGSVRIAAHSFEANLANAVRFVESGNV